MTELEALQNAVKSTRVKHLEVIEKFQEDKRRTNKVYYLVLRGSVISPAVDYDKLNHFILGFSRALELVVEVAES